MTYQDIVSDLASRTAAAAHRPIAGGPRHQEEAWDILEDVRAALGRDHEQAAAAAMRLARLLTTPRGPDQTRGGLAPWQKRRVEDFVRSRLDRSVYVQELAQVAKLSVGHFARAFKETFGQPPHAYVIARRVERAQRLMLGTDEPLSQIAIACGFNDQAHLARTFRREVGAAPSDWRRLHATGGLHPATAAQAPLPTAA